MKINSTVLLAGALIAAGVVALVVRSQLSAPVAKQAAKAPVEKTAVLVAARDLSPGDFIDPSALRWEETAESVSRSFYFVSGKDSENKLFGATLRERIPAGTRLSSNMLVRPNEPGFVAAVLHPGMRAISIPTSAVASNSGLVSAGDRVDVILSLRRDEQPELAPTADKPVVVPMLAAQTVARNLRVLAMNSQTDTDVRPRQDVDGDATGKNAPARPRNPVYQTVTVEATPQQAEVLAVAKEVGLLQLALRSPVEVVDDADEGLTPVTRLADTTSIYGGSQGNVKVKTFRADKQDVQQFPAR
ncbi:Flp pilus assembly protein CpaB [Erwinia sp. S43]|uniref:Flp pilus assembly protein CpaB n=1 Tax=unclassified Erwinia TaxID=2622719 RepID=UPI00190C0947|nr:MULTISPECIES: Flp pilus assembly protein CpaB [unclassified Erwinia]MBK0034643.1 Flp pilus assembly protein CpaB [Erwinia sp. S43]MCW1874916.1 Flp pilus assembly protein CpaB [Erwinia sp. INIA01]